jgi:hypothetical protein
VVVVDPSDGPLFRLIELSVSLVPLSAFSCYCLPGRLLRLVTVLLAGLSVLSVPSSISLFCSAVLLSLCIIAVPVFSILLPRLYFTGLVCGMFEVLRCC